MGAFKHTISFVPQKNVEDKKKPVAIRCFVSYNNKMVAFATGLYIETRYWAFDKVGDKKKRSFRDRVKSVAGFDRKTLIDKLTEIESYVQKSFDHLTDKYAEFPDPQLLRETCNHVLKTNGQLPGVSKANRPSDIFAYMEQLINDTNAGRRVKPDGSRFAPGTIRGYNTAYGVLKEFGKYQKRATYRFDEVDQDFYQDLREYCFNVKNFADNYFGTVVKFIKTAMNDSAEQGYHNCVQYKSKRFVRVSVPVENVYLNEAQLKAISELDLTHNYRLDRARDLLLIGSHTGLRFSDFTNIQPKNINGDFIEIRTQKTGENVAIPIHSTVKAIMEKYAGKTFNSLPEPISNVKLNVYIKEVVKLASENYPLLGMGDPVSLDKARSGKDIVVTKKFYEMVSTHSCRRSFASNAFRMGVPSEIIRSITGHKDSKSFDLYIKITSKEKAEILREIWNRQSMKIA